MAYESETWKGAKHIFLLRTAKLLEEIRPGSLQELSRPWGADPKIVANMPIPEEFKTAGGKDMEEINRHLCTLAEQAAKER